MKGQAGFWDIEHRLAELSAEGDPLETLSATVDFEIFRVVSSVVVQEAADRPAGATATSLATAGRLPASYTTARGTTNERTSSSLLPHDAPPRKDDFKRFPTMKYWFCESAVSLTTCFEGEGFVLGGGAWDF